MDIPGRLGSILGEEHSAFLILTTVSRDLGVSVCPVPFFKPTSRRFSFLRLPTTSKRVEHELLN